MTSLVIQIPELNKSNLIFSNQDKIYWNEAITCCSRTSQDISDIEGRILDRIHLLPLRKEVKWPSYISPGV